ncbi:MAG TPA: caspase family protein, partial [Planctomycetaceae bacterium]
MNEVKELRSWLSTALVAAFYSLAWTFGAAADSGLDWRPDKTWVFAVGVLEYQHPDVWRNQPAAKTDRRDVQLVEHFRKTGVPAAQIVYLQDREATQKHIRQSLAQLLERTRQGDLLILYYTGHGSRDHKTREVHFVNYDAKDGPTAWSVAEIAKTVDQGFQGEKALLMADCCYSGGLYDELKRHDRRVPFACLCSSFSHNSSTGNWTYSD